MTTTTANKTDWVIVAEIAQEKSVDMRILIDHDKHRDQASVAKRSAVLREAHERGVRVSSLTTICPMSERTIRKLLGDGLRFKRQVAETVP